MSDTGVVEALPLSSAMRDCSLTESGKDCCVGPNDGSMAEAEGVQFDTITLAVAGRAHCEDKWERF